MNIWQQLARLGRPVIALSPMDGLTNLPMRLITKKYGQPDLMFTEFVNVEGLFHARERLLPMLAHTADEGPVIAQLYGLEPGYFYQAARLVCELGFAGVDINMGCPAKNVVSHGAGGGLIRDWASAAEIFRQVQAGVRDFAQENGTEVLPVSIKTRLGYASTEEMPAWLEFLLALEPAAISLHGRTLKQVYSGLADWEKIAQAVSLAAQSQTLILGNGDLKNFASAQEKCLFSGVFGVLIGRGALGNPFVFKEQETNQKKLAHVALEHCQLYEKYSMSTPRASFLPMRTHLAAYIRGFPQASKVRAALMQTNSSREVELILAQNELI